MKLQLALDFGELDDLLALAVKLGDLVDWIEVGTYLIKRDGVRAISAFRDALPTKTVVADLKIADAGAAEARLAFDAGANIATVLGCAADATIRGAVEQASCQHGRIMLDLLGVPDKLRRAVEAEALGVDFICVHTGWDEASSVGEPMAQLDEITRAVATPLVFAGGIAPETVAGYLRFGPHAIIVGRAITMSPDPLSAAQRLRDLISLPMGQAEVDRCPHVGCC